MTKVKEVNEAFEKTAKAKTAVMEFIDAESDSEDEPEEVTAPLLVDYLHLL